MTNIKNMLLFWIILYLFLARFFKIWSRKVQIHSIIHCVFAFVWTSYVLFINLSGKLLSTDFFNILNGLNNDEKNYVFMVIVHSLGYFIADTIDILIDSKNIKRRIYILHHIVAILGLFTVYWDSYLSIYAIWCLEVGAIVHHFKHSTEVYDFGLVAYIISNILYHVVYISSRIHMTFNTFIGFASLYKNGSNIANVVGLIVSIILLIQNFIWWGHNLKKSLCNVI